MISLKTKAPDYRDTEKYPLNNDEYMCLVIRECGTRSWSGHTDNSICRFCCGILYSSRELREAGMVLNDNGQPIPKESDVLRNEKRKGNVLGKTLRMFTVFRRRNSTRSTS